MANRIVESILDYMPIGTFCKCYYGNESEEDDQPIRWCRVNLTKGTLAISQEVSAHPRDKEKMIPHSTVEKLVEMTMSSFDEMKGKFSIPEDIDLYLSLSSIQIGVRPSFFGGHEMRVGFGYLHDIFKKQGEASAREVIRFIVAHEFAHHKNKDTLPSEKDKLKTIAASSPVSATLGNYFGLLYGVYSQLAMIGILELSRNFYMRFTEKRADMLAMKTIGNAQGAINLFTYYLCEFRAKRSQVEGEYKKYLISPEGNFRPDAEHPPFTERLRYALEFRDSK